jgi:hypothetical protein
MAITLDGTAGITTPGLTNTGSTTIVALTTTGNTILGDASTDTLNVGNGNLVTDASGNVGVGVTPSAWNASYKALELVGSWASLSSNDGYGTAHLASNCYATSTTAWAYKSASSYRATRYQSGIDGIHAWFNSAAGTAGNAITFTQAMTLDASGRLGIGQTSPISFIDVYGNGAYTYARFYRSDEAGYGGRVGNGNTLLGAAGTRSLGLDGFSSINFGIAGSQVAVIDSSGNLLVGTTTALGLVTVARSTASSYNYASNAISNQPDHMGFFNGGTNTGSIQRNGGSGVSYVTTSDYRLKENIAPMTGALTKVAQLKPVTYTWKLDGSEGQGFIAHELAEVVPDCVAGDKDAVNEDGSIKPQGIDTSFLVATLTAAIQEQQALITTLTARITALESA